MALSLRRFEPHLANAFVNYKGCVSYQHEGPKNPDGVQVQEVLKLPASVHLNNARMLSRYPEIAIYVHRGEQEEEHAESFRAHLKAQGFTVVGAGQVQGRIFHVRPGSGEHAEKKWALLIQALGKSLDRVNVQQEY